ncbi:MAG: M23 family metallopeptidase [Actinomycetota bacterium]
MTRPRALITVVAAATTLVVVGAMGAGAQVSLPPLLPTTTTTAPNPEPQPTPATTTVIDKLLKPGAPAPAPGPAPPAGAAKPAGGGHLPGNAGGEGETPPPDAGPFPSNLAAMMNSVRRTGSNRSFALVDGLKALTDLGMPIEEAMRVGMGRFPVAGRATYSHDWWFPRFGPGWRLHQGTDVFGERGTPLRSPTTGSVRFGDGGLGGISVYITQPDGTYFYLAHLDRRAPGLKSGQTVNVGDIVGYLGSSGNAAGGSPHLHFEVHPAIKIITVGKGRKRTTKAVAAPVRPGTVLPAIDPKPLLDLYLAEAMAQLPAIVANYRADRAAQAPAPVSEAVPVETAAIAGRHLAVGGLIAADAPLVRTPLLLLAFLLMVMVGVLMPVLAPKRALAGPSPPPPAAAGRRFGRARSKAVEAPAGDGSGSGTGKSRRPAHRKSKTAPAGAAPPATAGGRRLRRKGKEGAAPVPGTPPAGTSEVPLRPWQVAVAKAAAGATEAASTATRNGHGIGHTATRDGHGIGHTATRDGDGHTATRNGDGDGHTATRNGHGNGNGHSNGHGYDHTATRNGSGSDGSGSDGHGSAGRADASPRRSRSPRTPDPV